MQKSLLSYCIVLPILQAGDFNQTLADVISALGGNKSNPQCSEPGIDFKGQNYFGGFKDFH